VDKANNKFIADLESFSDDRAGLAIDLVGLIVYDLLLNKNVYRVQIIVFGRI
jgi:hypothetical protein